MGARKLSQSLAALTVIGLAATGCTPEPAPTPTPIPSAPSVSKSPTESPQERQQRVDYEAAEKAYRTFRAEYNRVLQDGGAENPTRIMKATAGNKYLAEVQRVAAAYNGFGYRQVGDEKIVFVKRIGHSATSVVLNVCEDTRQVHTEDKKRKIVGRGEMRLLDLEVEPQSGVWKLWSGTGKKVDACD